MSMSPTHQLQRLAVGALDLEVVDLTRRSPGRARSSSEPGVMLDLGAVLRVLVEAREHVEVVLPAAEDGEVAGGVVVRLTPVAALAPSPKISALMSPSGESLTASNSMRALVGSVRASQTPWLRAPFTQSRPASMCQSPPVTRQSGPSAGRSKLSSKLRQPSGGERG